VEGKENALTRAWQMTDCGEWSSSYSRVLGNVEHFHIVLILLKLSHVEAPPKSYRLLTEY